MSGWAKHTLSPSARRQLDTKNKAANLKAPLHQKTVTATAKLMSDNGQQLNYSVPHNEAALPTGKIKDNFRLTLRNSVQFFALSVPYGYCNFPSNTHKCGYCLYTL